MQRSNIILTRLQPDLKPFLWMGRSLFALVFISASLSRTAHAQSCTITFDSANSSKGNSSILSFPITVGGANRFLAVQVAVEGNDGASSITGVTYGGAPMSQVLQTVRPSGGGARQAIFVLTAPALGANNVTVNLSAGKPLEAGAVDYNGVDQSTPVGAVTSVQNSLSLLQQVSLTTTGPNSWILSNFLWYGNITLTLGGGQTQRWSQAQTDSAEGDDEQALTVGSHLLSYTLLSLAGADIQAVEIHPCGFSTPTYTPTATMTFTSTFTPTPTPTVTNSFTATPSPTATSTFTWTPTATFTVTGTQSPSNTPTPVPPTSTPVPAVTATPTPPSLPPVHAKPNPFTPALATNSEANFDLPASHGSGTLRIFDIRRRAIRTLDFTAGSTVTWDGKDGTGQIVHGGVYFFLLDIDGAVRKGTLVVIR